MKNVEMKPIVHYTDSDDSQSPSTNPVQFNSSCQVYFPFFDPLNVLLYYPPLFF